MIASGINLRVRTCSRVVVMYVTAKTYKIVPWFVVQKPHMTLSDRDKDDLRSTRSSKSNNGNVVYCDVGAGVAGTSALYHLIHSSVESTNNSAAAAALDIHIVDAGPAPGLGLETSTIRSGTAVLSTGRCSKIMTQLYACSTATFVEHHGIMGARRYLTATRTGLQIQKELAHAIQRSEEKDTAHNNDREQPLLRQLGSFYLAHETDETALRREFESLMQLTSNNDNTDQSIDGLQWYNREQLQSVPGCSRDFCSGIYLPNDAIVDSSRYAAGLVQVCTAATTTTTDPTPSSSSSSSSRSSVTCHWNTQVVGIGTTAPMDSEVTNNRQDARAWVDFDSGMRLYARHVVVATGAFVLPNKQQASETSAPATGGGGPLSPTIASLIKPCYSYLVHVPILDSATSRNHLTEAMSTVHNSSNFVTWGFTHDWCYVDGAVRTSGEDHYSAYKEAHRAERCAKLIDWTWQIYHVHDAAARCAHDAIPQQCGIYSETPDYVPLVGSVLRRRSDADVVADEDDESCSSPICYLVGCNAWGQAILSYAASLVPGLLGYRPLTDDERDALRLLSIRRFSQLPVYE
jgi:FAD dependent oxidoreductase